MKQKVLFIISLFIISNLHAAKPIPIAGELDLRGYTFADDNIPLDGQWEYYPNALYTSEDLSNGVEQKRQYIDFLSHWGANGQNKSLLKPNFGYATYRLKIIVGDNPGNLAVYVPHFYSAYGMFVNGEGFLSNGTVGKTEKTSKPYWRPFAKNLNLKPGENEIIIHVSNFSHYKGGVNKSIFLGNGESILSARNFGVGSSLFLAGCLLICTVLAFAMFWFNRRDYSALFFSLFCIGAFYRAIGTDEYVLHSVLTNLPWSISLRLEYFSLYLAAMFYANFISHLVSFKVPKLGTNIINGFSILMMLTLLLPTHIFTAFIGIYLIFVCISLVFLAANALIHLDMSHKMSWVTVFGASLLGVVVFTKIGAYFKIIPSSVWVEFIGYIIFIFTQAIALSIRFGRSLRESNYAAGAATKSRAEFLNTMSHELRTPMNAILGMTEFLGKTKLDKTQQEKVSTIQKNSESLLAIILDILSISELESGKIKLEKRPLSIEECVRGAVNLAVKEKRNKPIDLKINIDPDIPDRLVGDPTRLKQVFMNLISNAFKFTEKGTVTIEGKIKEQEGNQIHLMFKVSDTGIGMAASKMKGIFGAFSKGESGNARKYQGSGLGLSVAKELLSHMGGSLNIQSAKGKGTTVALNFHLGMPKMAEGAKPLPSAKSGEGGIDQKLKILYAEDNPVNQKLMVMMLKTFGLDIDVAENGKVAWHKALENNYHIILMDLQMPEMDGFEATKRIVADVRSRPVIIAVTANASSADKKKCFDAGMNDFVSKPIKADVLKEVIFKWQSMRKYLDDGSEDRSKIFNISA